jgi:hypothetical protein
MPTLSTFRINQPPGTPYANWDRARRDIQLAAIGGNVECEALEKAQSSYKWELISLPFGVSVAIIDGTTHTCNFALDTRGSYLIRLTVNEGLPNQYKTTLFIGVQMEGSGLCLPALGETRQDNSQSPYDGARGAEEKHLKILQWNEKRNSPWLKTKGVNYVITEDDDGYTIVPTVTGLLFTLPACRNGFRCTVICQTGITARVARAGADTIVGGWSSVSGNSWTSMYVHPNSQATIEGVSIPGGVPQWYCRGEGKVQDEGSDEQWYFGTGHADVSGSHGVYVDEIYGHDTYGDGSFERPYQTLSYACNEQEEPTSLAEFIAPITFFLAPGSYPGAVSLPVRLNISIVGRECIVSNDIYWPIDPELWDTFGLSPNDKPRLSICYDTDSYDYSSDGLALSTRQLSRFILSNGTLVAYNSNDGLGYSMPVHVLSILGVARDAFHIYNAPSDTGVATDVTKTMMLFIRDSKMINVSLIAGECDEDGASILDANEICINAARSYLVLRGTCCIDRIEDCQYDADYRYDHEGSAYSYGRIHGSYTKTNIIRSTQEKKSGSYFGFNSGSTPTYTNASSIVFDRRSLLHMAGSTTISFTVAFAGFSVLSTAVDSAFGRGWNLEDSIGWSTDCKIPNDGDSQTGSGRLFLDAYAHSSTQRPSGSSLSVSNRFSIILESGKYIIGAFDFSVNYVNVIGLGGTPGGVSAISDQGVVLIPGTSTVSFSATTAHLENFQILQRSDGPEKSCLLMMANANASFFKNLSFEMDPASIGDVYAVSINSGLTVGGVWEDCKTVLNGFLFGGSFAGTAIRCSAGGYSFAGWWGATPRDISCTGTLTDCSAGNGSFGATSSGGNATFNGIATRCRASGFAFGHTSGGGGTVYTGTCGGTLVDCDNYSTGGYGSFGYSQYGNAVVSAGTVLLRCFSGNRSFGCSATAAYAGTFSGKAVGCGADYSSFGANYADPTKAAFSTPAWAEDCYAGSQSFGACGAFTGVAVRCRSGYGSFGNVIVSSPAARLEECRVLHISATANRGGPGIWGAFVRDCVFRADAGQNIRVLNIKGGTAAGSDESKIFACDLYSGGVNPCVDTSVVPPGVEIQMAHCRMNTDLGANVVNVLANPFNVVDVNYDPSPMTP